MPTNQYAVGHIDPSQLPEGFFAKANEDGSAGGDAPYRIVQGSQLEGLGLDADYNYAIKADGDIEPVYVTTIDRPTSGAGTDAVTQPETVVDTNSMKLASELGVDMSKRNDHGVPDGGEFDGKSYSLSRSRYPTSNDNFQNLLGGAILTAGGALVGGAASGAGAATEAGGSTFVGDLPLATDAAGSSIYAAGGGADILGSLDNFIEAGKWDAAMSDMLGVSSQADIDAIMQSIQSGAMSGVSSAEDLAGLNEVASPVGDPGPGASPDGFDKGAGPAADGANGPGQVKAPPSTPEQSLLDKYMPKNPVVQAALVNGAMQIGGGILKGIGDQETANDLIEKKREEQEKLEEWKRRFVQSGSYFSAQNRMKPGQGILKRPDGRPVYAPGGGIVNGNMGGG